MRTREKNRIKLGMLKCSGNTTAWNLEDPTSGRDKFGMFNYVIWNCDIGSSL